MHALVFVVGDQVHEQLKPQLRKHIDFYHIGGRWSGFLPKRGADGAVEEVDSLRAGEIAWDEAIAEVESSARAGFAEWRGICETHGRPRSRLEISRDLGLEIGRFGHYPEEVYAIYRRQPALEAFAKAHPGNIYCPINLFGFDEEKHVERVVAARMCPFAMVVAGHWTQGPVGLDDPEPQWCAAVRDRLRSLPPDTLVTAVDCHI